MKKSLVIASCAFLVATPAAYGQVLARIVPSVHKVTSPEIAIVRDEYVAATNMADAGKVAGLYADDALFVPREGVVLRGRTEIAKYFADALRQSAGAGVVTISPFEAQTKDLLGSETGSFEESGTTAAGTAVRVSGVYVIIYAQGADGRWRIAMEVRTHGNQRALVRW